MTIDGYTIDGWPIHPDYKEKKTDDPAPLRRSPKCYDIPKEIMLFKKFVKKEME